MLDEFYSLNKDDPNYSLQGATVNRGQYAHTDGLFTLSDPAQSELIAVFLATRQEMENGASTKCSARISSAAIFVSIGELYCL